MKTQTPLSKAINSQSAAQAESVTFAALCFELDLNADGELPEWLQLIPVGDVKGRDGREWHNDDPEQVIANTLAIGRDVPMDFEHSTEIKAQKGEPAPATGWFKEFKVEDGFIWGRIEFNETGANAVQKKEYRYISPVFTFTKVDRVVYAITSVALTNRPNLFLSALNSQTGNYNEDDAMTLEELLAQLRAALKLGDNATAEAALNAIQKLNADLAVALNNQHAPSLDKFVPRADYDIALNRATTAETELASVKKAEQDKEIETAINSALEAGKIAPASKDFYIAACNQEGGLAQFKKFLESAPLVTSDSGLDGKKPGEPETALNAEQQQIADMFGNSAEDLKKYA